MAHIQYILFKEMAMIPSLTTGTTCVHAYPIQVTNKILFTVLQPMSQFPADMGKSLLLLKRG